MTVLTIALTITAILLFTGGAAAIVLSIEEYLRQRANPPRHLKTTNYPALTVEEAIKND